MSLATPPNVRKLQRKLYVAAKEQPERRFHQLHDKVYREDVLLYAYRSARRANGAPGVDGVTFAQIESTGVERWLAAIKEDLHALTYKPAPVRRVMIPKPNGGERPLGIPTIRDRVVQHAARLVLEPIFEADFVDEAYGYRPRRSARQAVEAVHHTLCDGYTDVVDADLTKYFDTIPHDRLLRSVARRVSDGKMLRLIKGWLTVPIQESGGRRVQGARRKRGTPQGGVISPLLAKGPKGDRHPLEPTPPRRTCLSLFEAGPDDPIVIGWPTTKSSFPDFEICTRPKGDRHPLEPTPPRRTCLSLFEAGPDDPIGHRPARRQLEPA